MTIPNRLTLARILVTPVFYGVFLFAKAQPDPLWLLAPWILFLLAELSDILDGWIARKWSLTSDLGKVLDPFADVVSRLTYFAIFMQEGIFPLWAFLPILYRELGITFLRMIMIKNGQVLAANWAGKSKAWFYFFSATGAFLYFTFSSSLGLDKDNILRGLHILFGLTATISVVSIIPYLQKAKKAF